MSVAVENAAAPVERSSDLGVRLLLRVFLRSLFLQAAWNPRGMQNLGLAYCLFPALKKLYPNPEKLNAAVERHLTFFNTHPYTAAAIVGGILFHEQRIAKGEEDPKRVEEFKAALMGPLAALGDGFFWLSLKPAVGAASAAMVPVIGAWAALVFLVLYNLVHLYLRARLMWIGLTRGEGLIEEIARADLPGRGAALRALAAASAGGLAAFLAMTFGANEPGYLQVLLVLGCLGVGSLAYWFVAQKVPKYLVLYVAAALAGVAGAVL